MWIVWDFTDKTCALPSWLHINMKGKPTFFTAAGYTYNHEQVTVHDMGAERKLLCGRFAARIWATIHYEKQDAFLGGLPPNQVLIDETKLREQVNHDMAKVRCPSKRDSLYSWLVHITYPHVWQTHVSYTDSINVPMPWVIKCPH